MSGKILQRVELAGGATVNGVEVISEEGAVVAPVDSALSSGNIYVGSVSDVADEVVMSGDASISNTGVVTVTNVGDSVFQRSTTNIVATADGLTSGTILGGTTFVSVTSDDVNKIITVPGITGGGIRLTIITEATGCELRTTASSSVQINGVNCDGTNELALAAGSIFELVSTDSTHWTASGQSQAGAAIATLVPNPA
jgi:hypothetical protein